jgi:hypothetical protein
MSRSESWSLYPQLTALGMEICCIYSGLALMRERLGWGLGPFLLILLSYPSSYLLNLTITRRAGLSEKRSLLVFLGLAFLLGAAAVSFLDIGSLQDFRPKEADLLAVMFQMGLCALLWWSGVSSIPHRTAHRHLQVRFQITAVMMLAFVLLGARILTPVILFFIFALPALALARSDESASRSKGMLQPVKRRSLTLGTLAVLVPGMILLFVLSPDLGRTLLGAGARYGTTLIRWLDQGVPPPPTGKMVEIPFLSGCAGRAQRDKSPFPEMRPSADGIGAGSDEGFLWVVIAALAATIGLTLFTIAISRVKRRPEAVQGIAFETSPVKIGLLEGLTVLLGKIGRVLLRLFRIIRKFGATLFLRKRPKDASFPTPRALYRAFLQWAKGQGFPRPRPQTPLEYLEILRMRFPRESRDLSLITETYIRARYGRRPPSPEEFKEATAAWRRVRYVTPEKR